LREGKETDYTGLSCLLLRLSRLKVEQVWRESDFVPGGLSVGLLSHLQGDCKKAGRSTSVEFRIEACLNMCVREGEMR
jgi:hypothetical protein